MKKILVSFFTLLLASTGSAQTDKDTLFEATSFNNQGSRTVTCKKHDYYETFNHKKWIITVIYSPKDTGVNMVAISLQKPRKIKGSIFNDGRVYRYEDGPIEDFSIVNTGKEMYLQYIKDKRVTKVPFNM